MVGNPILNIGKANCQGGEGVKAPPAPPEINPVHVIYMYNRKCFFSSKNYA